MAKITSIPALLKATRISKGESQSQVANAVGVSRESICLYEKGKRHPSDPIKTKLAKHFGVTVGFLFYGER